jgi:hypothetical protein
VVTCPSCGVEIEADFGMTTCPSCSVVFMVNYDGVAEAPSANEPAEIPAEDDLAPLEYATPALEEAGSPLEEHNVSYEYPTETPTDDFMDSSSEDAEEEAQLDYQDSLMESSSEENIYMQPAAVGAAEGEEENYSEDFLDSLDGPLVSEEVVEDLPEDPLGISRFDQTGASQLMEGPLYYDLIISGLDTADIKREILRALDDQRFLWSLDELKGKFHGGKLTLKNLNPVKAVLLMIKIQHIDVDIRWEQKPFTDPSVGSGTTGQP